MLRCYNIGCSSNGSFDPETSHDRSCTYHAKRPYFHDGYKIWPCCEKKSTDFTVFMGLAGCTRGPHSNEKPQEPAAVVNGDKPTPETTSCSSSDNKKAAKGEVETYGIERIIKAPPSVLEIQRPPADDPLLDLKLTIGPGVQQAVDKIQLAKGMSDTKLTSNKETDDESVVKMGAKCCHNGCNAIYNGPDTETTENCRYHPGVAIFHEADKYWSCCKKKRTEWEQFFNEPGCQLGDHDFTQRKIDSCRFDHIDTGQQSVTVVFYAKTTVPSSARFQANRVKLSVSFEFEGGAKNFQKDFLLWGTVRPELSSVKITPNKIEVKLKKLELCRWAALLYPQQME